MWHALRLPVQYRHYSMPKNHWHNENYNPDEPDDLLLDLHVGCIYRLRPE